MIKTTTTTILSYGNNFQIIVKGQNYIKTVYMVDKFEIAKNCKEKTCFTLNETTYLKQAILSLHIIKFIILDVWGYGRGQVFPVTKHIG